jgi:hypothetical protein
MSLLLIDGFEGYGTSIGSAPSPSGIMGRRYNMYYEYTIDVGAGRIDGYCAEFHSSSNIIATLTNTDDTIIVGFAFRLGNNYSLDILRFYESGTLGIRLHCDHTTGNLTILNKSVSLETTSGLGLAVGAWYWLEVKIVVGVAGSYEVRCRGETVLQDSGIDTRATANDYLNQILIGNHQTTSRIICYDDLYVCNGAGAINNDFLGNVHVYALYPDGAGNSSDWTANTGNNYECVGEAVVDNDTTYVESNTSNDVDLYTYDDISSDVIGIKGIQINTDCRETSANSYSIKNTTRFDGTDYESAAQPVGSTNYVTLSDILETDPTGNAWTDTTLNGTEFGYTVD